MTVRIKRVFAREILDSRGNPTVEAEVIAAGGVIGRASVPSGASTGTFEAFELRDKGKRLSGLGVQKAVRNINKIIAKKLAGIDASAQEKIDRKMIEIDGTANKSKLGANAILAVSLACARTAAMAKNQPLYLYLAKLARRKPKMPMPFLNVINGGKHASNKLAFQEFMIAPQQAKFGEGIAAAAEVYHALKKIVERKFWCGIGDEGGFAPNITSAEEALDLIELAIGEAGHRSSMRIAIDAAASEFYNSSKYVIQKGVFPKKMNAAELSDYYLGLIKDYKLISIEDPFYEYDFESFAALTKKAGIQIVGDDLLVTNTERIEQAARVKACNCLLLKPNQVGTLTETLEAAKLAFKNRWNVMVSHRSGETEDSFIADLAAGLGCGQIKTGAPCRGERTAKYNQLLRISEVLRG